MNTFKTERFRDKQLGFAMYLIGEAIMFATLFATYLIYTPTAINPIPEEVFEARTVIIASVFLLTSSATIHYGEKAVEKGNHKGIWTGLVTTFLLSVGFIGMEAHEFQTYYKEGFTLTQNLFLSSFYILVGLHASHVLFGMGWMLVLAYQKNRIPFINYAQKQNIFSYYWHFVDVIWIFIIALVYGPYLFY